MISEKQLVIFRIEYTRKNGWGAVSNFVTKYGDCIEINSDDVQNVTSYVMGSRNRRHYELAKIAVKNAKNFRKINRPENIYMNKEKYEYLIYIHVNFSELDDVVELQNMYLILNECRKNDIIAIICGKTDEYYKISQYLQLLTSDKKFFYEGIFFTYENMTGTKHLQTNHIGILGKFLPLFPIDVHSEYQLRQDTEKEISPETLELILQNSEIMQAPIIISGALRVLGKKKSLFANCNISDCANKLSKVNVLTLLLFCFSVGNRKEDFADTGEVLRVLQDISLWADGCIQLIENIIFHSPNKRGAFSFRILNDNSNYLKEKYGKTQTETNWIELKISDYSGCYGTKNIAENFKANLPEQGMREEFKNLQPADFFIDRNDESVRTAWEKYYKEYTNIINHYGLKIFCNVIKKSGGCFIMQSFSEHIPHRGEYCCSDMEWEYAAEMSFPGTSYSIVYPMKLTEIIEKYEDYGIEELDCIEEYAEEIFQYDVFYQNIELKYLYHETGDKPGQIEKMAACFLDAVKNEKQNQIWAFNVKHMHGSEAEVIYKAFILGILQSKNNVHAVLYNCSGEFVEMILDMAYHVWQNLWGSKALSEKKTQIAVYTDDYYEEILIIPGDWPATLEINRKVNFSRETRWKDYFDKWEYKYDNHPENIKHIPFDVLVEIDDKGTIFEHYACVVIGRNIQEKELGCKLADTHMRLGSTIHVNHFYEAEVLFGNALFVERFAMLLVKRLCCESEGSLNSNSCLTLYGYTNYSEQVIFRTMQLLKEKIKGIDVDYAILERETENRGFAHIDQIRYSRCFQSGQEQKKYFESRKIVCIIPIASTLKTNEKLINLFCQENGKECKERFIHNYELILVSPENENLYWKKGNGRTIDGNKGMEIQPSPEFFIEVKLEYMEPLKCKMCFPNKLVDEIPLIEVNAASTIPNQAFGIIKEKKCSMPDTEAVRAEEMEISILKDSMLYMHLERGENHFLFYCQTNLLFVKFQDEIRKWLESIRNEIKLSKDDFAVLFCPSHFSNAGFVEYVNSIIFRGGAVVLRDDVDKEYRCNFKTKYSNLHDFIEKIAEYNRQGLMKNSHVRFFFVDDSIVSGRTFQRSKSLVQSIIGNNPYSEQQKYNVFDSVFVLLDRNSQFSRWQYVGVDEDEKHFFAFRTLHISSIRNHGDACILCNLENESGILKESAVTRGMSDYWKREEVKFSPRKVGKYQQEEKEQYGLESEKERNLRKVKHERAYRRMICTNNAGKFLDADYHGNDKIETLKAIMTLILTGCSIQREEEKSEYFLSYCKVLSRPFRVFDKAIKEAVFDFLLVLGESVISGINFTDIIEESDKKEYLKNKELHDLFLAVENFAATYFKCEKDRRDLILVLLKQLTELKSNFIIRVDMMNKLSDYANNMEQSERNIFYEYYQRLVKKLLGISSDTSKSVWFDRMLFYRKEEDGISLLKMPKNVIERLYLENVRVYQDAYNKLHERLCADGVDWTYYFGNEAKDISKNELTLFGERLGLYIKGYQFKDFIAVMEQYGFSACNELTEQGKILAAANVLLYRYIFSEFQGELSSHVGYEEDQIRDKCNYIATYMKYILDAEKTMIIMELDAEYDIWEDILINRFNSMIEEMQEEKIPVKSQKEYIVLGSSEPGKFNEVVREDKFVGLMKKFYEEQELKKQGYVCDFELNIFLWELGQDEGHPVYVYSEWENTPESSSDYDFQLRRWNRMRNVMQYYWKLNERVFNRSNNGFFHELVSTGKNLLFHSRYKAYSHTKSDVRLKQFEHVNYQEKYNGYYQSDLLKLLADLNVSEHYRKSLTRDYYFPHIPIAIAKWNSPISIYREEMEQAFFVVNSDSMSPIKVRVDYEAVFENDSKLRTDEEILCFDFTNAEREPLLLLYSLICNAATDNRGLVHDDEVTVWLSKTENNQLRIANIVGENSEGSRPSVINKELKIPPIGDDNGISLWGMSRYIKKLISAIIENKIRQFAGIPESQRKGLSSELRSTICRLLSDEFEVSVKREAVGENEYFSVFVPILAEKYKEFLKENRR